MALLCVSGAFGHFLLIRAYQRTQASLLQPFAYLQLATAASLGVAIFGEALSWTTLLGSAIVVLAGLSNLWIERRRVTV